MFLYNHFDVGQNWLTTTVDAVKSKEFTKLSLFEKNGYPKLVV